MMVLVDDDVIVAAATSSRVVELHELMAYVYRRRHVVIGNFEPWFATLDQQTAGSYRAAMAYSIRGSTTHIGSVATIHIKLNANGTWHDPIAELCLADALRLLQEPLGIIVENATNDWNFLRKLVTQVAREILDQALNNGWITILHGGGAEMVANISRRAAVQHRILRTFAMFDSDRHHPDELAADWQPAAQVTCQGYNTENTAREHLGSRYWRLERRFIESYLPKAELAAHEEANRNISAGATDAFFRMPQRSRSYYNMKSGFNSITNNAQVRQQDLYAGVAGPDLALLAKGFGRAAGRYTDSQANFAWDTEARAEAEAQLPKLLRLI